MLTDDDIEKRAHFACKIIERLEDLTADELRKVLALVDLYNAYHDTGFIVEVHTKSVRSMGEEAIEA